MLKSGKKNTTAQMVDKTKLNLQPEPTLKWTYNYFSRGSRDSTNDWQDNLPIVLKDALYEDEE